MLLFFLDRKYKFISRDVFLRYVFSQYNLSSTWKINYCMEDKLMYPGEQQMKPKMAYNFFTYTR